MLLPDGRNTLQRLVDLAVEKPGYETLEPVVTKEIVHYDMLHVLSKARLLDGLTFQGGTALRLCHGGQRLSEDLDFAGGRNFDGSRLDAIADILERHVGTRYGLDVRVKAPTVRDVTEGVEVRRWTLSIDTDPGRPDLPRQRIKLKIANVPAHDGAAMAVRVNYDANGQPTGFTPATEEDAAALSDLTGTEVSVGDTIDTESPSHESGPTHADRPLGGQLDNGRTPTASEIEDYADGQGWNRSQTEGGPVKYTDENGTVRVTIKSGSARTPGSEGPHVELRDVNGNRIDRNGIPVPRRDRLNHTPIISDKI